MLFPNLEEGSVFISRTDVNEQFGTHSYHPFRLDDAEWPSVEHYFQAMKFDGVNDGHKERVRTAKDPKQARKLGRSKLKKIRKDWSKMKRVVMTRAVYIKCRTHPQIAEALLATEDRKIYENSMYDYFWGCGRDRRGANTYGEVLMDVRRKLKEEAGGAE